MPTFSVLLLLASPALFIGCSGSEDSASEDSASEGSGSDGEGRGGKKAGRGDGSERGGRGGRSGRGGRRGGPGGPPGGFAGGGESSRGVPVEVAAVGRQTISLFFETNGTLEAENEVDLVARVSGPITQLNTEEGQRVRKGQLLATIDDREIVAQLEVAKVRLDEARQSYERIKELFEKELVARESYDQAFASFESAKGDLERLDVQLAYTRITAPFSGLVVQRYVKFAEFLQNGARLFRLSDFDPLLCPIQVPERELSKLSIGQRAELTVESFGDTRFDAKVLRVSPVVDSASGTVKVTLEVSGQGKLRPGMFANVFLEMANRPNALVVPKAALALDSLGNTVYVVNDGMAARRDLELGFRNDALLEVLSGLEEGEQIVVVGQDGLTDGTPIEILSSGGTVSDSDPSDGAPSARPGSDDRPGPGFRGAEAGRDEIGRDEIGRSEGGRGERGGRGGRFRDLDLNDPEQVKRVKERMRERGMTDSEIEERLERMKERRRQRGEGGGE